MPYELHAHNMSRPQMMLNAIEEVRNEMNNTSEYRRLTRLSTRKLGIIEKRFNPKKKKQSTAQHPKIKQEQIRRYPEITLENENLNILDYLIHVNVDGSIPQYKGPEHSAVHMIFTWLAYTKGLGFAAVAIKQTAFDDAIKQIKKKH